MSIILSIKPEFAEKILSGEKKYEFRRQIWNKRRDIKKAYIYASSPIKKVVGYILIGKIIKGYPIKIWQLCKENAGISEKEFLAYFGRRLQGYAIEIRKVEKYDIPIEKEILIGALRAPQNFMYIQENYIKIRKIPISRSNKKHMEKIKKK